MSGRHVSIRLLISIAAETKASSEASLYSSADARGPSARTAPPSTTASSREAKPRHNATHGALSAVAGSGRRRRHYAPDCKVKVSVAMGASENLPVPRRLTMVPGGTVAALSKEKSSPPSVPASHG